MIAQMKMNLRRIRSGKVQFSLRALFLFTTVTALFAGWLGRAYDEFRTEQDILAQLPNAYRVDSRVLAYF